jgi:hypothetical protein
MYEIHDTIINFPIKEWDDVSFFKSVHRTRISNPTIIEIGLIKNVSPSDFIFNLIRKDEFTLNNIFQDLLFNEKHDEYYSLDDTFYSL